MQRVTRFLILLIICFAVIFGFIFYSCTNEASGGGGRGNPAPTNTGSPQPEADWLSYLNSLRALANLPGVVENTSYSYGNELHARYMVRNDVLIHNEFQENPFYSPEGQAAAQNSNLYATTAASLTPQEAINNWVIGPFHGISMIDPALRESGYGSYSATDGGYQSAAGLDVIRGRGEIPASVQFPIMWPAQGKTVDLTTYSGNESPNPLSNSSYRAPTGLPIYLLLGTGSITPEVTSSSFTEGSTSLPHIILTETTYVNSNQGEQEIGRNVLGSRDAIVLIPQSPLTPGSTYTVSITVNGTLYSWSFSVSPNAQ